MSLSLYTLNSFKSYHVLKCSMWQSNLGLESDSKYESSRYVLIPYVEEESGLGLVKNSQIKGKCTCLGVGRALFESLAPLPTMGMALSKSTNFSELQVFLRVNLVGLIRESVDTSGILSAFLPFYSATILSVYYMLGTLQWAKNGKHRAYSHAYNLIEIKKKTTNTVLEMLW